MNRYVRWYSSWSSSSRLITWACTETSSDETGSSATMNWGCMAIARAMPILCRCPPENW